MLFVHFHLLAVLTFAVTPETEPVDDKWASVVAVVRLNLLSRTAFSAWQPLESTVSDRVSDCDPCPVLSGELSISLSLRFELISASLLGLGATPIVRTRDSMLRDPTLADVLLRA